MKKLKNRYPANKTYNTLIFLFEKEQNKLAWKLWRIEVYRCFLNSLGRRLNRLQDKNKARWDSVRIDIDHFILINQEKGS